ncbi:MAG: DNA-directed RNA polymerase subunit alpha [Thermoanaerobaculia bacterium]
METQIFQRPKSLEADQKSLTPTYGKFVARPFERGFANTIGNAMRRCLLSSIEGAAVAAVRIEGVLHEFSAIPGVVEDVTDIILNLKEIPFLLHSDEPKVITLDAAGDGAVSAGQFNADSNVEICDQDAAIATLNESGNLKLEAQIKKGRGYISAERNFDEALGLGWIPVDSVHSPIKRVNYRVEAARVGRATDYEQLLLEVWTNGTVSPEDAVSQAADLLRKHLGIFIGSEESLIEEAEAEAPSMSSALDSILTKRIDELDLSVRSTNCLKNANIMTLRDLVAKSERDMLETKNFGKKSLDEVHALLESYGLSFGMDLEGGA